MPTIILLVMFFGQNKTSAQLPIGTNLTPYKGNIYHTGGNIGIGTDSPAELLHLYSDTITTFRLSSKCDKCGVQSWDFRTFHGNLDFYYKEINRYYSVLTLTQDKQLAIGTQSPNYSAIMQLESTGKGLLIPRMTSAEKSAILSPANGLLVYDTDLRTFSYYDAVAASWQNTAVSSDLSDYLLINDFNASVAGGITQSDTANWNAAFLWGNHADAGYITDASLNYLWQEDGNGNIYRENGNVGIGTKSPSKLLDIYASYDYAIGSYPEKSTIRLVNEIRYSKAIEPGPGPTPPGNKYYKWDIENDNKELSFKYIAYASDNIGKSTIPVTKFTFSGDGTLTAAKFVGDGSGLTNIGLNGPLILDNDMEAWTNSGWSARLQSPLGTVWASTDKSNLGDYYLGLGMTNSGWYFIRKYDNGDKDYVTVIREDGRIQCTEVIIETDEWKDIVFNKDYKLRSIEETEQYISQHGHLPDIPSEKEMIKNGLETSEMIKLQMQKIEELTLYIIEQNKRIKKLEEAVNSGQ